MSFIDAVEYVKCNECISLIENVRPKAHTLACEVEEQAGLTVIMY